MLRIMPTKYMIFAAFFIIKPPLPIYCKPILDKKIPPLNEGIN
jgi:hypothetical protein